MPFDGLQRPFDYVAKFDEVIALIEAPNRWTKGAYRTPGGQFCLKEALNIVGVTEIFERAILRTAATVADREFCCLESFNDCPETIHADVVFVLRRVREDIVAGRVDLPAPASARFAYGREGGGGKAAATWLLGFWRKVLC